MILTAVDIVENPSTVETVTKTFSVAQTGVETFDCTSSFTIGLEGVPGVEDVTVATLTVDATDDAITTGVLGLGGISGLAGTTVWLIIMIAFTIGIYFRGADIGWSGSSTTGAIAIANVLFIVIGARLGILSTGLVVIIVLMGVVILGVFLGKFLTGSSDLPNNN